VRRATEQDSRLEAMQTKYRHLGDQVSWVKWFQVLSLRLSADEYPLILSATFLHLRGACLLRSHDCCVFARHGIGARRGR